MNNTDMLNKSKIDVIHYHLNNTAALNKKFEYHIDTFRFTPLHKKLIKYSFFTIEYITIIAYVVFSENPFALQHIALNLFLCRTH